MRASDSLSLALFLLAAARLGLACLRVRFRATRLGVLGLGRLCYLILRLLHGLRRHNTGHNGEHFTLELVQPIQNDRRLAAKFKRHVVVRYLDDEHLHLRPRFDNKSRPTRVALAHLERLSLELAPMLDVHHAGRPTVNKKQVRRLFFDAYVYPKTAGNKEGASFTRHA